MQYIYKAHSHAIKFQQSLGPFIYFPQTFAKICHMTHQRKTSLMRIPWRPSEDTQASLSDCLSWLCQIMVTINNEISVSGEAMGVINHCNSSSFNVLSFRSIWYRLYSEDYSKLIRLTRPKVWLNNPRNLNHSPNFSIRLIIININHRTVTKAILKTDRCIWLGLHLDNVTYDTLEKPVQHRTVVYIHLPVLLLAFFILFTRKQTRHDIMAEIDCLTQEQNKVWEQVSVYSDWRVKTRSFVKLIGHTLACLLGSLTYVTK